MEALDSVLFTIPEIVDYQASFDKKLNIHCLCLKLDIAPQIHAAVMRKYPGLDVSIDLTLITRQHRPLYPGKRNLIPGQAAHATAPSPSNRFLLK